MGIHVGDKVLYVEESKRKWKMYNLGNVVKVGMAGTGGVVWIIDVDGSQHVVYERHVVVVECGHNVLVG